MTQKDLTKINPLLTCSLILFFCVILFSSFKKLYSGDEIASFMFATAHSNEYQDSTMFFFENGQPIKAERLKQFYKTDPDFSFSEISKDIGTNDWHPPLYFYVLGETVKIWGTNVYVGMWLNLLFKLLNLFLLYQIALHFFTNKRYAFIAILIWSLSHANTYIMFESRQYELLCTCMLAHLYFFMRWLNGRHWTNLIVAAFFTICGYLTHYTFLPVSTGILIAGIVLFHKRPFKNISVALIILISSGVAFILIHPYFLDSLAILKHKDLVFSAQGIFFRLGKSVLSIFDFIIPVFELKSTFYQLSNQFNTKILLLLFAVIVMLLLVFILKKLRPSFLSFKSNNLTTNQLFIIIYVIWMACALFGSYLSFEAPQHAMGRKYLVMFFPFLAIFITYLISFLQKESFWYKTLFATLCCGMIIRTVSEKTYQDKLGEVDRITSKQTVIYTTSFDRRGFARLIPQLQNDASIIPLDKEKLLQDTFTFKHEGIVLSSTPFEEKILQLQHLQKGFSYATVDSNGYYFYTIAP